MLSDIDKPTIRLFEEKKEVPYQNKSAVVVIGRMNPPSKGHIKLINTAKKQMLQDKYDAVIVVVVDGKETSKDKKRNPLSADERIRFLKNNKSCDGVRFVQADGVMSGLYHIRELGFEPLCVVGGSGGSEDKNTAIAYKEILDKYFLKKGVPVDHKAVSVERDLKDVVGRISSTMMRSAAEKGYYEEFAEMAAPVDADSVKRMYDIVRKSMGIE